MSISIEKLKAHDEAELEKAYQELRAYGMMILAAETKARNWPLKEEDWKDIFQETFVEIERGIIKFDDWEKLRTYFSDAIKNRARDKMRKELADKRGGGKVLTTDRIDLASDSAFSDDGFYYLAAAMLQDDLAPHSPLPKVAYTSDSIVTDQVLSNEVREQLRLSLAELDAHDRKLLEDAFVKRLSHKEIATQNSWTVKSIGGRINRALGRLRAHVPSELKKELRSSSRNRPGLA
jgi:RNA polymerase sigma factor (sigma-70 family)